MIRLVDTLGVYGEALEADFAEVYGLDLASVLAQGRWARVKRLITNLPTSSRFVINVSRSVPDSNTQSPDITWWNRSDRLLATIIDQLTIANWQRSGGKKKPSLLTDLPSTETPIQRVKLDQEKVRAHLKSIGPQKAAS